MIAIFLKDMVVVSGYQLGRNLLRQIAKFPGHGIFETIIKTVFIYMKPVAEAPDFIAGLGLLADIGDSLVHDVILSVFVADVQIGKDKLFQPTLL